MIYEPMTVFTDVLLALLGAVFAWMLRQSGDRILWGRRLWAWALAVQGLGALLGGIYHGVGYHLFPQVASLLWHAVLVTLSGGTGLLVAGLAYLTFERGGRIIIFVAMGIKVFGYAIWILRRDDFLPALCDQGITLILLLVMLIKSGSCRPRPWATGGILLAVAGGIVQVSITVPVQGFNHNDFYHIIEAAALMCFYRAGRLFAA